MYLTARRSAALQWVKNATHSTCITRGKAPLNFSIPAGRANSSLKNTSKYITWPLIAKPLSLNPAVKAPC